MVHNSIICFFYSMTWMKFTSCICIRESLFGRKNVLNICLQY
ncbi:unnamed protein product [Acanthoscelides obtectus]|uniref:Uncharacterized protein n=1 Tax=Acanthoscelides obtectus TaxID=200917 RepID=A0A9P0KBG4_ACAOB|nr:unnamed protein product [Acanthoscelides obtectus]CAK1660870.1 hypothetical protein AOBTE_LOCUS22302 [Acanthoscelides obtectus]